MSLKHYVVEIVNDISDEVMQTWDTMREHFDLREFKFYLRELHFLAAQGIENRLMHANVYVVDAPYKLDSIPAVDGLNPVLSIEAMTVVYGATINVYMTCNKYVRVMSIAY